MINYIIIKKNNSLNSRLQINQNYSGYKAGDNYIEKENFQ